MCKQGQQDILKSTFKFPVVFVLMKTDILIRNMMFFLPEHLSSSTAVTTGNI